MNEDLIAGGRNDSAKLNKVRLELRVGKEDIGWKEMRDFFFKIGGNF